MQLVYVAYLQFVKIGNSRQKRDYWNSNRQAKRPVDFVLIYCSKN